MRRIRSCTESPSGPFNSLRSSLRPRRLLRLLLVERRLRPITFRSDPPEWNSYYERGNRRRRPERSHQPGARCARAPMPARHHHRSANPGRCTGGARPSVRPDDLAAHVIKAVSSEAASPGSDRRRLSGRRQPGRRRQPQRGPHGRPSGLPETVPGATVNRSARQRPGGDQHRRPHDRGGPW